MRAGHWGVAMAKSIALPGAKITASPAGRGFGMRRLLTYGVAVIIIVALWEGAKTLFALPDYKLPHIITIFEVLGRPTPKGMTLWVLLGDTLYTGLEAVLGFVLGGIAGFLLAALFVHVKPAERGLLPYVVASQTVPIIALAPMI